MNRFRWSNPITIYCIQDAQSERMPAQVIVQHVSQFNVFVTYEERSKKRNSLERFSVLVRVFNAVGMGASF
jgi:hypothetical protein